MPLVTAVIFDLDDTLFAERDYAFSGFAAVAEAFADRLGDATASTERMRQLFDTEHRRRVFNVLVQERGLPDDHALITEMIGVYRTHRPSITLFTDADEVLTRLRTAGKKLGLISDGPAEMQAAKVAALGLNSRLDTVILTAELGEGFGKPHPLAFERMADRLGTPHTACAYVADNAAKDFVAPNQLGWTTVQIKRPGGVYRDEVPPLGGEPGAVIQSLDELDPLLA